MNVADIFLQKKNPNWKNNKNISGNDAYQFSVLTY